MKRIFFLIITITIIFAIGITSCRPEISLTKPEDYKIESWGDLFASFWSGMDHYYLYWDVDKTDWDNIWDQYKPKFDALPNEAAVSTLKEYFTDITKDISDGHFSFALLRDNNPVITIDPQVQKVLARSEQYAVQLYKYNNDWSGKSSGNNTNYNFFNSTIKKYMSNSKSGNFSHKDANGNTVKVIKCGTGHISIDSTAEANDYILYLYFDSFSLTTVLMKKVLAGDSFEVLKQFFNDLCNDQNMKGVILDVRGNSGGAVDDVYLLLGPMINQQIEIGKNRIKSGPGRLQYTPWTPLYLYPAPSSSIRPVNIPAGTGITFKRSPNAGNIPVVAVVNEFSISCAELTAMAVAQMPKGYVVGKRTFGATGPRYDYTFVSNGGPFTTNPGNRTVIEITQAGWATQSAAGVNYEGVGVPVTKEVNLNWSKFYGSGTGGRDDQLAAAILRIDPAHKMP